MGFDDVSERLAASAPVSEPALVEMLARYEGRPVTELEDELGAAHQRLREWAARPENAGRPVSECPEHLTRIALGALIERRLFAE